MVFTEPNLNVLAKPATVVVACGLSITNSLVRERRVREGGRKERGKEGKGERRAREGERKGNGKGREEGGSGERKRE